MHQSQCVSTLRRNKVWIVTKNKAHLSSGFKWKEESYIAAIEQEHFMDRLANINNSTFCPTASGIDTLCKDITAVLINAARLMLTWIEKPEMLNGTITIYRSW